MFIPSSLDDNKEQDLDKIRQESFFRTLDCLFNEETVTTTEREVLKHKKILLVDDSKKDRLEIAETLCKNGFEVVEVSSGIDAIEQVDDIHPDLILMEIIMQGTDGLVVCESIRKQKKFDDVPIIFLSSLSNKRFVIRGLQAGASDYITKPFDEEEALARIHAHLKLRDLTLEKEKTNEELNESNKALQEAVLAKDKMLSVTTHDLKNPLAAIRGILDFMADEEFGALNETQKEMLSEVKQASDSMFELITDILSLGSIEADSIQLNKSEKDIVALTNHLIQLCQFQAEQKQIKLGLVKEGDIQPFAFDERQVRRVIQNLINNAIKFSPFEKQIIVRIEQSENETTLSVNDEGPGVPDEEQCKLFTEYGRTSVKSTAGESSTGLGLSICKKIIEAHDGKIWMKNREPNGSEFAFRIPSWYVAIPPLSGKENT